MRRQAHGFFYAVHFFMVGGVLGGRKACRILDPVDQPDTSSIAQSLVTPVDGLITVQESPMNTVLSWLVGIAPLRHKIAVRLFQIRYQRALRVVRAVLLPLALRREV